MYIDKQNPTFVMDIARHYDMFVGATRIYLMMVFYLGRVFLDKSLNVDQRVYWIWRIKSFCEVEEVSTFCYQLKVLPI